MDASLRNTPGLIARIDKVRDDLIKRFQNIIRVTTVNNTDRNATAVIQYQMQVETAALIQRAQDLQTLIRQLQEMWLFGQLNTVGENRIQQQTNENARAVADMLGQLADRQHVAVDGVPLAEQQKEPIPTDTA